MDRLAARGEEPMLTPRLASPHHLQRASLEHAPSTRTSLPATFDSRVVTAEFRDCIHGVVSEDLKPSINLGCLFWDGGDTP